MTDEEKVLQSETGKVDTVTEDYLAAIKELKANSVSREDYDALRAENKKLLDSVLNGVTPIEETKTEVIPTKDDIQKMREYLFNPEIDKTNLTYVEKTLELRDALIKSGEPDPFLPQARKFAPTREDIECAEKCATVYRECIEYAQGDSEAFTTELMRRTRDVRTR